MPVLKIQTKAHVLDLLLKANGFGGRFNIIPDGKNVSKLIVCKMESNEIRRLSNIMDVAGIPCGMKTSQRVTQVRFFSGSLYEKIKGLESMAQAPC